MTGQRADKAPLPGFLAKVMLNYDLNEANVQRDSPPGSRPYIYLIYSSQFFNEVRYDTDISEVKKIHPGRLTFEEYLRKSVKA